ncbi:MAG: hypothetical protein SFX74_10720, partial [Fimbriimonadaceae bacterium]|nr:hypothetical protein [Fimbriimonadaceae bacterium]
AEAVAELKTFDPRLEGLTSATLSEVEGMASRRTEVERSVDERRLELARWAPRSTSSETDLTGADPAAFDDVAFDRLRQRVLAFGEAEREEEEARTRFAEADAERQNRRRALVGEATGETPTPADWDRVFELLSERLKLQATAEAARELAEDTRPWLATPADAVSRETAERRLAELWRYLAAPGETVDLETFRRQRMMAAVGVGIVGVVGALGVWLFPAAGFAIVTVAAVASVAWVWFLLRELPVIPDARVKPEVLSGEAGDVVRIGTAEVERLVQANVADTLRPIRGKLDMRADTRGRDLAKHEGEAREASPFVDLAQAARAQAKARWEESAVAADRAEAALNAAALHLRDTRAAVAIELARVGLPPAADAASATAELHRLEKFLAARRDLANAEREQVRSAQALDNRLASLGVASVDELRELDRQRAAFSTAQDRHRTARATAASSRRQLTLRELPVIESPSAEQVAEWERSVAEKTVLEAKRDAEIHEIARLQTEVKRYSDPAQLEQLRAAVDNAQAQFDSLAVAMARQTIQQRFAELINRRVRELNKPKTVIEAERLFKRITRDRYELRADAEPLTVYDRVERSEKQIMQLSSGTAIQLYLAVRVGTLAVDEAALGGFRAPLILDELLATADPERGEAIGQALQVIAQDRQVIYFTPTAHEQEWFGPSAEHVRLSPISRIVRATVPPVTDAVVAPDAGEPYEAYAERVGRRPVDPYAGIAAVDPGWLLTEPDALYRARLAGADYWDAYASDGAELPADVRLRADALREALELWKIGRPTAPIPDHLIQKEMGARAEQLWSIWQQSDFRPERFESLAKSAGMKRLAGVIEKLTELGALSTEPPLPPEEMRRRIISALPAEDLRAARRAAEHAIAVLGIPAEPTPPEPAALEEYPGLPFDGGADESGE